MTDLPEAWNLLDELKITTRPMSKKTSEVLHQPESLMVNFGVSPQNLGGAQSLAGPQSIFQAIPVASSTSEYVEAIQIHADESGNFYDPNDYQFYDYDPETHHDPAPSPITEVPTSTTNPTRPRTVAAGYRYFKERRSGTLTVVFRDGTFWNYYDVPNLIWNNFKTARSKGRYIAVHLDKLAYGPADVSSFNAEYRSTLYRLARTGQILREGYTGKQVKGTKRGTAHTKHTTYGPNWGGTRRAREKKNGTR